MKKESYELLWKVIKWWRKLHNFFFEQRFFFNSAAMLFNFFMSISIIARHFLYLLYFCSCLDLGLIMSYLYHLFFIFIFIFIMIDRIISWMQTHLFFCLFSRICPIYFRMKNVNKFSISKSSASGRCLAFAWCFWQFQSGVAYKSAAYKKSVYQHVAENVDSRASSSKLSRI